MARQRSRNRGNIAQPNSSGYGQQYDSAPVTHRAPANSNSYRQPYSDSPRANYGYDERYRQEPAANHRYYEEPKRSKKPAVFATVMVIAALGALALFAYYWLYDARGTAPDVRESPDGDSFAPGIADNVDRREGVYTFLIFGIDESNTDSIMVGTLDTVNSTFEIVSIPRDTLVNVGWTTKKANSIYANMRHQHRNDSDSETAAMEATVERFRDILGFKVDYWIMVDFRGFASLVDAIGGVDFHVPVDMHHSGYTFPSGMHHLSGEQALHVVRYRGFSNADIGRIGTQQDFLAAVAGQLLANRDSIRVRNMAETFLRYAVTDISLSNLVWFGERFLELDSEDITFHTMPGNYWDTVSGVSYVTIYTDDWLNMINTYINPWHTPRTINDFSILTRGGGGSLVVVGRER